LIQASSFGRATEVVELHGLADGAHRGAPSLRFAYLAGDGPTGEPPSRYDCADMDIAVVTVLDIVVILMNWSS
jgi:hypothetical protein